MRPLLAACVLLLASDLAARGQPANTASSPAIPSGPPLVRQWTPPQFPPELLAAKIKGSATVQFIVDEKGGISGARVLEASRPEFGEAALASLNTWVCDPAVDEGKPIVACAISTLHFRLPYNPPKLAPPMESLPRFAPTVGAQGEMTELPPYPPALEPRRLNGEVLFDLEVDAEGKVASVQLRGATHPAFVRIARDGVRNWTFAPGKQGDLPVTTRVRVPVHYSVYVPSFEDGIPSQLEANGFHLRLPPETSARQVCDVPPELWVLVDPVYPYELMKAGIAGETEIDFTINLQGYVENPVIRTQSHPELAKAALAALVLTNFKPAVQEGRAVTVAVTRKFSVSAPPDTPAENEPPEHRIMRLLRAGQPLAAPRELDAKLAPLWRIAPRYPDALQADGPAGNAVIEFVIDRDGLARFPRIVSASHEDFGWAAATAVMCWAFEPPTRGGEPVDVRVQVPFNFPARAKTAAQ